MPRPSTAVSRAHVKWHGSRPGSAVTRAFASVLLGISAFIGSADMEAQPVVTTRHSGGNGSPTLWGISGFGTRTIVAVGERGTILRSIDSETWRPIASGTTESLMSIAGDFRVTFVIVGDHGTILVSRDQGLTWARATNPATRARLNGVANLFSNDEPASRWLAVGENGTIIVSADGDNWTPVASGTTAGLRAIGYWFPNRLLVAGQSGTVLKSEDGPNWSQWTKVATGTERDLEAFASDVNAMPVIAGEAGFVGVGAGVYPMPVPAASGTTERIRGAIRTMAGTVAVGENGTIVVSQPDARLPWSRLDSAGPMALNALVTSPRGIMAVGSNETILQIVPPDPTRMINLSSRAFVRGGDDVLIAGFSFDGRAPKRLLIRAAGPVLNQFGITNALSKPLLTIFDSTGRQMASNAGWETGGGGSALQAAASQIGAFPFPPGGEDSAVLLTLPAGSYTGHVVSLNRSSGIAVLEIYDLDPIDNDHGRLTNISTRGFFGSGQQIVIPGVVLRGNGTRNLLIRAIGPALAQFGVVSPLPDPQLNVAGLFTNDWNEQRYTFSADEVRELSRRAGAFALPEGSKDAATIYSAYTGVFSQLGLMANDTRDAQGEVLIEIYDVTGL